MDGGRRHRAEWCERVTCSTAEHKGRGRHADDDRDVDQVRQAWSAADGGGKRQPVWRRGRVVGHRLASLPAGRGAFSRCSEPSHAAPVLPNPPVARTVSSSASTSCQSMRRTGERTACAIRMPRSMTNGASPAFMTITCSSPR